MSHTYFQKPENALKRAEEFVEVDKPEDAINALHAALGARKFKQQWTQVMETIVLKLIELCIPHKKLKIMKEGLYQYRAICQQANVQSLQYVVEHCRDLAEKKVEAVKAEVSKNEADEAKRLEDLDEEPSPEEVMLMSMQADVKKDVDRDVHAWLRSLWEVYKTILDLLKNNAKLEDCYHETARRGFDFCRENDRQLEFKRLCDTVRNHQASTKSNSTFENAVNANNPHTIQRMLETRFKQMHVAIECNLWREAQQTVDDLFQLMQSKGGKRGPRPVFISQYFAGLSKIFWNGNFNSFHAAALLKHYSLHKKQSKTFTEKAMELANASVLAVMSIPLNRHENKNKGIEIEVDSMKDRHRRFAQLLKSKDIPTRASLLAELKTRDVVCAASPAVQRLYSLMETEFTPLSLCRDAKPLLDEIIADDNISQYSELLRKVIFTRFAGQLSRVYSSIEMDSFLEMASIVSAAEAEKWLVQASNPNSSEYGAVHAKIDHQNRGIHFSVGDFHSNSLRNQLQTLGIALTVATAKLFPEQDREEEKEWKERIFTNVAQRLEDDHKKVFSRKRLIERRKEQNEKADAIKVQNDREAAEKAAAERKEQERARQEAERQKREFERVEKAKKDAEMKQSLAVLEQIKAQQAAKKDGEDKVTIKVQGKRLEDLDAEDLQKLDTNQLEKARETALKQEKLQKVRDFKRAFKNNDHMARALREEEVELIKKWSVEMAETDKKVLKQLSLDRVEQSKAKHAKQLEKKKALSEFKDIIDSFREKKLKGIRKQFDVDMRQWQDYRTEFLIEGKVQRATDRYNAEQDRERLEREAEERAEREAEAAEERRIEEERRAEERKIAEEERQAEREARATERKAANAENDRIQEKIAAREREIEERRAAESVAAREKRAEPRQEKKAPDSKADEADTWRSARAPTGGRDRVPERQSSDRNKDDGPWRRGGAPPARDEPKKDDSAGGWRATAVPKRENKEESGTGAWRRGPDRDAPKEEAAPEGWRPRERPTGRAPREEGDKKDDAPGAWRSAAPKRDDDDADGDRWGRARAAPPAGDRDEKPSAWRGNGGAARDEKKPAGDDWRTAAPRSRGEQNGREGGGDDWRASPGANGERSKGGKGKGEGKGSKGGKDGLPRRQESGGGNAWRDRATKNDNDNNNWRGGGGGDENRGPRKEARGWGDAAEKKPETVAPKENSTENVDDDGFSQVVKGRRRR